MFRRDVAGYHEPLAKKIMKIFILILLLLLGVSSSLLSAEYKPTGQWIDRQSMVTADLPQAGDIPYLLLDFEYKNNEKPKAYKFDFNSDGTEDFLVESSDSLCGTGGCPYALIDGASQKRIGDFFGSPLLFHKSKINDWPIVHSYAHLSFSSGNYSVFVFGNSKYNEVARITLKEKSISDYFESINHFQKIR